MTTEVFKLLVAASRKPGTVIIYRPSWREEPVPAGFYKAGRVFGGSLKETTHRSAIPVQVLFPAVC